MVKRGSIATVFGCVLVSGMFSASIRCQQPPADSTAVPQNPRELMVVAARLNGLNGADVQPWHLKASFQILDESGNIIDRGTYDEFWAAPTRYKRTYASSKYSQTDYGTAKGVLRSGRYDQIPALISDIRREFVDPMLNQQAIARQSFGPSLQDLDGERLNCLIITGLPMNPGRSWCLPVGTAVLRRTSSTGESLQVIHDRPVRFQGRFVAGDLRFIRAGKLALTAHLESVEALKPEAILEPSSDAVPLRRRINISAGVAVGLLEKHENPVYPADAHVSGTVSLMAVIGVGGHVEQLSVVSGPPILQAAAIEAVRKWTYRPFLLNNEPVEVMTQINVVFKR